MSGSDIQIGYRLGLCKPSPKPTRPTGTDLPAPPLPSTDGADAGDQNTNVVLMPVRWGHRRRKRSTEWEPNRTNEGISLCFCCLWCRLHPDPISFLIFFTKASSYWYYYKLKKKKNTHTHTHTKRHRFMLGFQISLSINSLYSIS